MDLVDFIKKNKIMVIAVCVIIFLLILNNCNDKREHMTGDDSNITITGTADNGTIEGTLSNTNADGATTETTITGNISGTITSGTITGIITDGNISGIIVNNDITNTISGTITDNTITVVSVEDNSSEPSVGTCHETSLESNPPRRLTRNPQTTARKIGRCDICRSTLQFAAFSGIVAAQ